MARSEIGYGTWYCLVLYGGTAIGLRLGHRPSVDFDFFSEKPLDLARDEKTTLVNAVAAVRELPEVTIVPSHLTAEIVPR